MNFTVCVLRRKAATNQKEKKSRSEWISFNSSEQEGEDNGIHPRFSQLFVIFFACVLLCECLWKHTYNMDNPFRIVSCQKNCYISQLFLPQRKIYFLQAQGSTPSIIFICSDKHQLLLLLPISLSLLHTWIEKRRHVSYVIVEEENLGRRV